MSENQPLITIESKMGILYKAFYLLLLLFSCIVVYSLIYVLFQTNLADLAESIKNEWATILIFPFILLFIWGIYFCLRELIAGNKRKVILYDNHFIIKTNRFFQIKTLKLHYGQYGLRMTGIAIPPLHHIMFFDIAKQKPKFFDIKFKCQINYSALDSDFEIRLAEFADIFKQKTREFLQMQDKKTHFMNDFLYTQLDVIAK